MRRRTALAGIASVVAAPALVRAADAPTLKVAVTGSVSDAPFYIAEAKGYFRDVQLAVELTRLQAGATMVPFLGTGQLDAGAGGISAGLFNAITRGIGIKIVADKALAAPGYGYTPLCVRKDLVEGGKVKSYADLRGLKIAEVAQATASFCDLVMALRKGGLTYKDVTEVYLGFPEHVAAYHNASIDAGLTTEPFATLAVAAGDVVRFAPQDAFYPNHMTTVLLYGKNLLENRPLGERFMLAYLRGARDYHDALKNGKLDGPFAGELIEIMTKATPLKDPAIYRRLTPNAIDPNGEPNMTSLSNDIAIFKETGIIDASLTPPATVDRSFAVAAVRTLGPYRPR